jgi:hypothetical protein
MVQALKQVSDFEDIKNLGNRLEEKLKENKVKGAPEKSFREFLKEVFSEENIDPSSFLTEEEMERLKREHSKSTKKTSKKKMNKGGYGGMAMKKPEMMKGGMYKGKKHMYAAGGLVKEIKM